MKRHTGFDFCCLRSSSSGGLGSRSGDSRAMESGDQLSASPSDWPNRVGGHLQPSRGLAEENAAQGFRRTDCGRLLHRTAGAVFASRSAHAAFNRRYLDQLFSHQSSAINRSGRAATFVLIAVRPDEERPASDEVLTKAAFVVRSNFRGSDVIVRCRARSVSNRDAGHRRSPGTDCTEPPCR